MRFVEPNHFTDPDAAARKLVQIANAVEAVQDGRIFIELINGPSSRRAELRTNSARLSPARSGWAGHGGMTPALT